MNHRLIITAIIISAIVVTGLSCGGECKVARDCDDGNVCTRDSCVSKKCIHNIMADCHIGDGICDRDEGENECTAPQDCGFCTGEDIKHLTYQCIDDECVAELADIKISEEVFSEIVTERGGLSMTITYEYENPFNIDEELFKIKIDLESSPTTTSDIKIKKVQLIEKERKVTRMLGDKDIDKPLFMDISVEDGIPLKIPTTDREKEVKPTVKIIYEFLENKQTRKTVTYEKTFTNDIILVDPTTARICPDCDDDNDCTQDTCSEATNYFCEHTPTKRSCCGNFVCDTDENECTCAEDCGYCERDYGLYMRYRCSNNECLPMIKDPGVIKPKTLIKDMSFGDFQTEIKITIDEPFNIQGSRIKVDMEAKTINVGAQNIKCKKLQLVEGDELLGEANVNIAFASVGQISSGILYPDDFLRSAEESRSPTLKINCEYDKDYRGSLQHYTKTQSIALGQMTFVSPK